MKRLTIHLKSVGKYKVGTKDMIKNTLSFRVTDEEEALTIVQKYNNNPRKKNNVSKWYLSNIK